MITRRKALTLVTASLAASTSLAGFASAQFLGPFSDRHRDRERERERDRERSRAREAERAREAALNRDRERARQEVQRIVATLDPWKTSPAPVNAHYEATIALINFFARLGPFETSNSIPRADFLDMISRIGDINLKVNTVLETRKLSDQTIRRTLSAMVKSDKTTQSDIRINKITEVLNPYFLGQGFYSYEHSRLHHGSLTQLAREVLDLNYDLSQWGPDAFYTSARGYAIYQFVTNCVRQNLFSPNTARAYALKVAAESHSYFGIKTAELNVAQVDPTRLRPRPAAARFEVEQKLIDGGYGAGFPRDIYLGTDVPNFDQPGRSSRGERNRESIREIGCPAGQVANYYGRLVGDFEKSFTLAPANPIDKVCATEINDKNLPAINGLMMNRFKDFAPKGFQNADAYRNMLEDIKNTLNQHIRNITRARQNEENANRDPTAQEAEIEKRELLFEFRGIHDMAWGIREILSSM